MPNNVRDDLIECHKIGQIWRQEFVDGCFEDENRFDKTISHRKVNNFTIVATKSIIRGKDEK